MELEVNPAIVAAKKEQFIRVQGAALKYAREMRETGLKELSRSFKDASGDHVWMTVDSRFLYGMYRIVSKDFKAYFAPETNGNA